MDRQGKARRGSTLAAAAPCFCPSAPAHPFNHSSQLVLPPAHTGPRPPPHQATTATAEISHPHEGRRSDVEQLMHRFRGDSFRPSMECMLDGSDTAAFSPPGFGSPTHRYHPIIPSCKRFLNAGTGYLAADSRSPMKQVAS